MFGDVITHYLVPFGGWMPFGERELITAIVACLHIEFVDIYHVLVKESIWPPYRGLSFFIHCVIRKIFICFCFYD